MDALIRFVISTFFTGCILLTGLLVGTFVMQYTQETFIVMGAAFLVMILAVWPAAKLELKAKKYMGVI